MSEKLTCSRSLSLLSLSTSSLDPLECLAPHATEYSLKPSTPSLVLPLKTAGDPLSNVLSLLSYFPLSQTSQPPSLLPLSLLSKLPQNISQQNTLFSVSGVFPFKKNNLPKKYLPCKRLSLLTNITFPP